MSLLTFRPHRRVAHLVTSAGLVLLAACNGDGGTLLSRPVPSDPVRSQGGPEVKASKDFAELMVRTPSAPRGERGGTGLQLDAAVFNPQGHELPHKKHVYWTSLDTMIVTVDSTGLMTAQDTGRALVVVDHKKGVDTVQIAVIPVPVRTVTIAGVDSISLADSTQLVAATLDSVGEPLHGRAVAWSSSEPGVVRLTATALAIGDAVGTSTIKAESETASATHKLRVWPQPVVRVTVSPATVSVPQFHKVRFTATAYDKRGNELADRPVTWTSSAPAIFYIKANADTAAGKDLGTATVTATVEGKASTAAVTVTSPVEARALWVTRFEYTTPSAVDFAKIATIMQKAAQAKFNIVYFQVRTSGDALYRSTIEPCSPRMCGRLGGPWPSQDPLEVAIREGAQHGIEVHAWLNAYTGFISGSTTACGQFIESTPRNWLKANPHWVVSTKNFSTNTITPQNVCATTSEYMWVSPGIDSVRAQVARVAADIVTRYGPLGLRGIHLDRIRFPSNQVSYDSGSLKAFHAATNAYPASNAQASWLEFRRGLVNRGVKEVYDAIQAVNPSIVLSAAVFPGYKREGRMATWAAQWSHSDLFQDPQAWAQGGYLDVEAPMNYPATSTSASWTVKEYCSNTDWTCVLDDHIARIERQAGRHVYVGIGAIKGWDETRRQIDLAHDRSATGLSVYSFSQIDAIPNGWALLGSGPFKHKATVPSMPWK